MEKTINYDERKQILTIRLVKNEKNFGADYKDTFKKEEIKKLYQKFISNKKTLSENIEMDEKLLKSKQEQLKKLKIPELTESQKQLLKDLEIISKMEPAKKIEQEIEAINERLKSMNDQLKDTKAMAHEILTKVKIKLE
jgi:hypothetical protein